MALARRGFRLPLGQSPRLNTLAIPLRLLPTSLSACFRPPITPAGTPTRPAFGLATA